MKIIEAGRPQKGWAKEFRCTGKGNSDGGCGAKLLVEQGDLFTTASHCRDETTTYVTFQCAACSVLTDLGESWKVRLPSNIKLPTYKVWQTDSSADQAEN